MADGLDRLAGFSGQSREALLGIWESVKANQARLDACPLHDFGELQNKLGARYTCRNCGGHTDASAVSWYQAGLAHGMGRASPPINESRAA